jgi:hypothetical protein
MKRNPQQDKWSQRFDQLTEIERDQIINAPERLEKGFIRAFALIDDESFSKEYRKLYGDWLINVAKVLVKENLKSLNECYDT